MDELLEELEAEKEKIIATIDELQKILQTKRKEFVELAAIATCLLNFYNGIENLFKRTLNYIKIPLPTSETFHRDLLDLTVKHNLISQELSVQLDEYRAFRHFFVHGYGILLKEAPLQTLAQDIFSVWQEFENQFNEFLTSLNKA
jgi:uncharacterized protein YutE (UPF0331/DUF86 family)